MKFLSLFPIFLSIFCLNSQAAIIITSLNSNDRIRGEVQSGLTAGYFTDAGGSTIGTSGSNSSNERRVDNLVYGFTLPTLPAGNTLSEATFEFIVTAYRDQNDSDGDVNLDYYILNTSDPNTGIDGLDFYRNDNSPGANEILLGQLDAFVRVDGNQTTITPASAGEVSVELSGSGLTYIQSLYDAGGNPTQAEVFFRLNIDSDNGVGLLDRFIIDTSSPALTLTTVVPEPSTTGLLLCGIAGLVLRRRR
jgi:hypothetical protein